MTNYYKIYQSYKKEDNLKLKFNFLYINSDN